MADAGSERENGTLACKVLPSRELGEVTLIGGIWFRAMTGIVCGKVFLPLRNLG